MRTLVLKRHVQASDITKARRVLSVFPLSASFEDPRHSCLISYGLQSEYVFKAWARLTVETVVD